MNIWYCVECGDYHYSQPNTVVDKLGRLQECSLCKTMSIVPLHEMSQAYPIGQDDITLDSFVRIMAHEFPNMTFDNPKAVYRPLNYLIQTLNRTEHFIHIVTESIDGFFLGMLSMKYFESDIDIHIIVWHPQRMYADLQRLMDHGIFVKGYEKAYRPITRGIFVETLSEAHQKLIVLDGCIAFYGSANATLDGWTREGELIKFTNNRAEIQKLNHDFFSKFVVKKRHRSSKQRRS